MMPVLPVEMPYDEYSEGLVFDTELPEYAWFMAFAFGCLEFEAGKALLQATGFDYYRFWPDG